MTIEDRALLAQLDAAKKRYLHGLELIAEVECMACCSTPAAWMRSREGHGCRSVVRHR